MADPTSSCVLVVADPDRIAELASALAEPLGPTATSASGAVEVVTSSGGDDTIDLFTARRPPVVVVTASLEDGDSRALIETLRGLVPRAEVAIIVVGDDTGPIRTALDAIELAPDRFVGRPLATKALRFAVGAGIETVALVRGTAGGAPGTPSAVDDDPTASSRAAQRARWATLADSLAAEPPEDTDDGATPVPIGDEPSEAAPLPPPLIQPRNRGAFAWQPGTTAVLDPDAALGEPPEAPPREPTLILRDSSASIPGPAMPSGPGLEPTTLVGIAAMPARAPGAVIIAPRATRYDDAAAPLVPRAATIAGTGIGAIPPAVERETSGPEGRPSDDGIAISRTSSGSSAIAVAERGPDDRESWSAPMPLRELSDPAGQLALDDLDELTPGGGADVAAPIVALGAGSARIGKAIDLIDDLPPDLTATGTAANANADAAAAEAGDGLGTRDFARQLRAKMSMMAQRLFQGADQGLPASTDLGPRHDHHTEIDLASLGDEQPLVEGNTEIESRAATRAAEVRELMTTPGSWDTQIRERGLPESGELVRGMSDAAALLAKMFHGEITGRVRFRRDDVDTVVFFDQGRPVFAASSEPRDRMGELLVREGKITLAQYERCQTMVAQSGRRMGEILVDLGYLKRRELLPAVRRHVEDLVYALFGWDRGQYSITLDREPSAERIRLSRHPASLILEGIRRKLDRATLERLLGPPSTVIELAARERVAAVLNVGDLAADERAALAAFDGQADLAAVARAAAVAAPRDPLTGIGTEPGTPVTQTQTVPRADVADVMPLAWGLCVLGLATARRADTEAPDESTALVGETDLAIDRERVRARWRLVSDADYFALLGVRRDATTFEIRRAYQSARRDFASDCFPGDLRRELARELDDIAHVLDEAFRVLRDDRLRLTYLSNLVE